jgi:D-aminopeptidase
MRMVAFMLAGLVLMQSGASRPRARDLGIAPGPFEPGPLNAITDVAGVKVGHRTLASGDNVRTGVTAILPHGGNLFQEKVPGAVFVGNAFGKLAGSTQVSELGTIETPIVLTNTLSVGTAIEAVVRWTLGHSGNERVRSVNAVVGETNDGTLNDIRGMHVGRDDVVAAIDAARSGPVEEGAVGAGTGTVAFGWKGGIGTSSRKVHEQGDTWTVGVLAQTNYGGRLTIAGVPIWKELAPGALPGRAVAGPAKAGHYADANNAGQADVGVDPATAGLHGEADGSCMIVVATDAPLDARDLRRVAARAIYALARTGSAYSNGSGDFAIAFSTHPSLRVTAATGPQPRTSLPTDAISGLFEATLDATEEAVYNSLLKANDVTANGTTVRALPVEPLKAILRKYGR